MPLLDTKDVSSTTNSVVSNDFVAIFYLFTRTINVYSLMPHDIIAGDYIPTTKCNNMPIWMRQST